MFTFVPLRVSFIPRTAAGAMVNTSVRSVSITLRKSSGRRSTALRSGALGSHGRWKLGRSFLDVGLAIRGWWPSAADQTRDDDDRHDIGRHGQKFRRNWRVQKRQFLLQRVGKSKDQRGAQRPDRVPAAKDHRRQSDEAAPTGHVLVEPTDRAQREPSAAKARDHAAQGHVDIAGAVDVDAKRIGGARVFADGARAQAATGMEKVIGGGGDKNQRAVDEKVLVEQHRPDNRNVAKDRYLPTSGTPGRCSGTGTRRRPGC